MKFKKQLSSGDFVVLAEMNTPKGIDISEFVSNARRIRDLVDGVIIPDMDDGIMKMSAIAGGALLQQQGMESIIHVYTRDRNRMALQGDLLGAHVLGIRNLIVVKGEDMAATDHSNAQKVDDLDELALLRTIRSLQDGADMGGSELKGNPQFIVGSTVAINRDGQDLEKELELAKKKVDAGAAFLVTPAVFDLERFSSRMEKVRPLKVPIIATVFLLKTVGIARYISTYEPGANLSEHVIKRIRQASDREMEGIRIAGETIMSLKDLAQGVKIVTLGWEHRLPAILECAGIS